MRGVEFTLPIVIGTAAFGLGKKATETETHRWTLYVRPGDGADMSDVVSKIAFHLHPTFHNPDRDAPPPYEMTETGWGEFELTADVHFVDAAGEPPVELAHRLRLYHDNDPGNVNPKRPVVAESYEEIVFSEPRVEFWRLLCSRTRRPPNPPLSVAAYVLDHSAEAELRRIAAARARVAQVKAAALKQLAALGATVDELAGVPSFAAVAGDESGGGG